MQKLSPFSRKIRSIARDISAVITVVGIPIIIGYAYYIYQEQKSAKDSQIDLLNTRVEMLKDTQIESMWAKLQISKQYYETELHDLETKLQRTTSLNDSLQNYLSGAIRLDSNRISITNEAARKILKDLMVGDACKKYVTSLERLSGAQDTLINILGHRIANLEQMVANLESLTKTQDELIKLCEDNK